MSLVDCMFAGLVWQRCIPCASRHLLYCRAAVPPCPSKTMFSAMAQCSGIGERRVTLPPPPSSSDISQGRGGAGASVSFWHCGGVREVLRRGSVVVWGA